MGKKKIDLESIFPVVRKGEDPEAKRKEFAQARLEALYKRHEAGDKTAILLCLATCIGNDVPIPQWCAYAFTVAIGDITSYRAESWEDVFGRAHKKGTNFHAHRKRNQYKMAVWKRIQSLRETKPDTAIDGYLFETVGKELGIGGKTLTEEYYYEVENTQKALRELLEKLKPG